MRIAVIGCGVMGRTHAHDLAKMPNVELVGVCDIREELAQSLAGKYHTTAYFSFEHMMAEANPDAISICLPTDMHKEYVMKAASIGKHVICEKPIAPTLGEAREMIDFCRKQGVRLFIAHVVRFFPNYVDMSRKIAAGVIGDVGIAHTKRIGGHPGRAKEWYNDAAKSGGVIMDLLIHDIDFMSSVLGGVKTVFALNRKTEEMDYALVTLRFAGGAIANLEGFWGYPGPFTTAVEFAGKKGVIRFNSNETSSLHIRKAASVNASTPAAVAVPKSPSVHDPYYYELEHFIECIRSGSEPLVTAEDAYEAVKIALAAIASVETGVPVNMKEFAAGQGGIQHG